MERSTMAMEMGWRISGTK